MPSRPAADVYHGLTLQAGFVQELIKYGGVQPDDEIIRLFIIGGGPKIIGPVRSDLFLSDAEGVFY